MHLTKRRFCGLDQVISMTCDHEKLNWMVQRNLIEVDAKCEKISFIRIIMHKTKFQVGNKIGDY